MQSHLNFHLLQEASLGCTHLGDQPLFTKSRLLAAALIFLFSKSALFYSMFHQLHTENANSMGWPPGSRQHSLSESVMKPSRL